ncbi:uncharacterized protein LOC144388928 [Gasterosteus aculeatus]
MAEGYTTNLPVSNQGPPESSEQFNAEYMSLREICEVLRSMRMKIHMSGIKVAGWECLKVKNDNYDHHRQEEGIARRKCETLQKEVKNLLVKVKNHQHFDSIYRDQKAVNEEMSSKHQKLEEEVDLQQKRLAHLKRVESNAASITQENEEYDQKIKLLETTLQKVTNECNLLSEASERDAHQLDMKKTLVKNLASKTALTHLDYKRLQYKNKELIAETQELEIQVSALGDEKSEINLKLVNQQRQIEDSMHRKDALERTTNDLKQQIQALNEELTSRESLAAQQKCQETVLEAQQRQLIKAHTEATSKLLSEKDWKAGYDAQRELNDALELKNNEWKENILSVMNSLKDLDACKANYKSMKTDIKVATRLNKTLEKQHKTLENKFSKEQKYEEKHNAIKSESETLMGENCTLQRQVEELQSTLQGTYVLTCIYNSLVSVKNANKLLNDDLLRELQQLHEEAAKEAPLKERNEAIRAENEIDNRQMDVLEEQVSSVACRKGAPERPWWFELSPAGPEQDT